MTRIFISYRRDDSAGHAGRLFDGLCARLGKDSVFMDVEGIEAGLDFVETIEAAVGSCDVLLAVIGRGWLDCKDSQGKRRLEDPRDFIRLETGTALARHIRVIPVLVEGATMPSQESLPDLLRPLTRRQAVELRDSRWEADIENLIQVLEHLLATPSAPGSAATAAVADATGTGKRGSAADKPADDSRRPLALWLGAAAGLIVAGGVIGYLMGPDGREQAPASPSRPLEMNAPAGPEATRQTPAPTATPPTASADKSSAPMSAQERQAAKQDTVSPVARKKTQPLKAPPSTARTLSVSPKDAVAVPGAKIAPAELPSLAKTPTHAAGPSIQATVPPPAPAAGKALKIAIIALGEPTSRSFWSGESTQTYSAKMTTLYDGTLREVVRGKIEAHIRTDGARSKTLIDGSPGIERQTCDSTGSRVIFVALAQQSFAISPAESAYWPELRLGAIACASGKRRVIHYNLSPRQGEAFPFAQDMAQAMTGFIRENLDLMQ